MTDATTTLLDAGALVPIKTKIQDASHVDQISARNYRHGGLGDRPVVRLSADNLAQGDDLEMEFLGFDAPTVQGPLAYRRRQALGFPGWALIHDPEHARYALELVKEFKKAVRKSKSKPGHGYDAFVEIAKGLGKSVAHFLPSFWEQVGREFIQIGNSTYASRAFGKAREAEKVHALKVDEKLRQDAFLEFALAGCLSNKALTEYGKELQQSLSGEEAWNFFRELCVRRTLGGMPPWTSLPKDLKPLITGAGLDLDEEMKKFLKEILESPSMNRANMGFWKACSKFIKELAAEDDHAAGILLNLMPDTSHWNRQICWEYFDLLEEWNLLQNVWNEGISEAAAPQGGPAGWFSKWCGLSDEPPQRLHDLLSTLAPRLKKEKTPIDLKVVSWGSPSVNVDLLDLALELKIPIAELPEDISINLTEWANVGKDAKDRPRDPKFMYAKPRFKKLLEEAVPHAVGNTEFEIAARGKESLAEARKNWLLGLIDRIAHGGLPAADEVLSELESKTTRETYVEFPEAFEKLKAVDLAPVLSRNLAGGVIDEYGWPIVEEIADKLSQNGKQTVTIFARFPYVMLTDGLNVVVTDHEKIVLEHELQLPKKAKLEDLLYYDGQLCVCYETSRYDDYFYWSSNPKKTTKQYSYTREKIGGAVVDLQGGGTFNGRRAIHAGDAERPSSPSRFFYDGEHFWTQTWRDGDRALRECDPKTGKEGRKSLPSFFEDGLQTGEELFENSCELLHLGDAVANSPLGQKNGSIGWRTRKTKGDKIQCDGIDGRTWTSSEECKHHTPEALVDQPGTREVLPITGSFGWSWSYEQAQLWDAGGQFELADWGEELGPYNQGQAASFPPLFWHAFQLRDAKASQKLRSTNQAQAQKLLTAVQKDLEQSDEIEDPLSDLPGTETAIKTWLKGSSSTRLHRGVLGIVYHAGEQVRRLTELIESCDPEAAISATSFDPVLEALVEPAMNVFNIHTGWGDSDPLFPHLGDVMAFLKGEKTKASILPPPFQWWQLLDNLESKLWEAYWSAEEGKQEWLTFLEHFAETGFFDLPGKFRHVRGEFSGPVPFKTSTKKRQRYSSDDQEWIGHTHQGNYYFLDQQYDDDWEILEYAPKGKFQLLPKFSIEYDETPAGFGATWSSDTVREFLACAREKEKPYLEPERLQSLAEQLAITPAEVGLVWFGYPNFNTYEKNFLPKHLREQLKLKVAEAAAAKQSLQAIPDEARGKLLTALLAGPPAELWEEGGAKPLARLTAAWEKHVPRRLAVPPKVLDQLTAAFPYDVDNGQMLVALASPKTHPLFTAQAEWKFHKAEDGYWTELWSKDQGETFDQSVLLASSICIPLLNYHLPVGDVVRNELPAIHQAALKCLNSPKLMLFFTSYQKWVDNDPDTGKAMLEKALGKKSKKHESGWLIEDGLVVGFAQGYKTDFAVRPAKLKTEKDYQQLKNIAKFLSSEDGHVESQGLTSLEFMRSEGFLALCDRIKNTPVPPGGYESNPDLSVPDLVAEVEKHHGLSHEAAVLYLQLLSLPDCTLANVKIWNDWTTAQFNKLGKELEKKSLVLEAKRARAGRKYFLPGGWEALKIPHLPLETWKMPLFSLTRNSEGQLQTPLTRILPLGPVHELFQSAWDRIQSGDEPSYEEVS